MNFSSTPILTLIILCNFKHLLLAEGELRVGFYSQTCPNAESIIASVVKEATTTNSRIPAILLRLHFHDCFVEGCDGSILIDNTERPEKKAFGHQGVQGYVEIEKAKAKLEAQCPGVVSCADIVALAARDAVVLSGGTFYEVETGRRDGRVSDEALAADMPDVDEPIESLKAKFINKGLSAIELVLLSGAHTIGTTACFFMPKRLYNFSGRNDSDPLINGTFLSKLQDQCPRNGDVNVRLPLDPDSGVKFDNQILQNIKNGFAVVSSDARLYEDSDTKKLVDFYAQNSSSTNIPQIGPPFLRDFGIAIVKMGRIGVKTGTEGEIRKVCNSFN